MQPTIYIVHEDDAVRESLGFFLETHGYRVVPSIGLADFERRFNGGPGCLVLAQDYMPGGGLSSLAMLRRRGIRLPAVIRTLVTAPQLHRQARGWNAVLVDALSICALPAAIREALAADNMP